MHVRIPLKSTFLVDFRSVSYFMKSLSSLTLVTVDLLTQDFMKQCVHILIVTALSTSGNGMDNVLSFHDSRHIVVGLSLNTNV